MRLVYAAHIEENLEVVFSGLIAEDVDGPELSRVEIDEVTLMGITVPLKCLDKELLNRLYSLHYDLEFE